MTRQEQTVGQDGQAIQANGNVTINQGFTHEQMLTVMDGVLGQLQGYIADAQKTAEHRMEEFKRDILTEFTKADGKSKPESFADPDYQAALRDACISYARSGEEQLRHELVRLLSARSAEKTNSRLAHILNLAIKSSGDFTGEEYSAMCGIFCFAHLKITANSKLELAQKVELAVAKITDQFPEGSSSYEYLESKGCISIHRVGKNNFWQNFIRTYKGLFTHGFSMLELCGIIEDYKLTLNAPIAIRPVVDHSIGTDGVQNGLVVPDPISFSILNEDELRSHLRERGVEDDACNKCVELYRRSIFSDEEIKSYMIKNSNNLEIFLKKWDNSVAGISTLTALGKVLAHSSLVSYVGFSTPLSLWVS